MITVVAITFGLAINFWLDCVLRGRSHDVVKMVTSTYSGNYQIYSKDYFNEKNIGSQLRVDENKIGELLKDKANYTTRVHLPSLISSGEQSLPVLLEGILPTQERSVSTLSKSIVSGDFLSEDGDCNPGAILIGKKLANSLKVDLGEKVVLLTQATDGTLGNELYRVKGLYDTGSSNFDKSYVFVNQKCAQAIGVLQGPHELVISLNKEDQGQKLFKQVQQILPSDHLLATWEESLPAVSRMVHVNNAIMGMVSAILLIVVVLGFVNTLLMSVMERTKEIGMMMALGIKGVEVQSVILLESLMIGLFSSFLAILIGSSAVLYHHFRGFDLSPFVGGKFEVNQYSLSLMIYPDLTLWPFVKVVLFSLAIVALSVVIPAYRASKLTPMDAIRS